GASVASAGDDRVEPGKAVPVTSAEPSRGDALAPVTLVVWSDFQCPFCAKLMGTLDDLARTYGPHKLRIVWRNNPLPFHKDARPAAIAAETVFRLGGREAFWAFARLAFENQKQLDPESYVRWAASAGVAEAAFTRAFERNEYASKVDDDMALAKSVG